MDKHVIEALGKARVTVQYGKVVDVGEPFNTEKLLMLENLRLNIVLFFISIEELKN